MGASTGHRYLAPGEITGFTPSCRQHPEVLLAEDTTTSSHQGSKRALVGGVMEVL